MSCCKEKGHNTRWLYEKRYWWQLKCDNDWGKNNIKSVYMVWICAKAATGEESGSHGFYFKKGQREARIAL